MNEEKKQSAGQAEPAAENARASNPADAAGAAEKNAGKASSEKAAGTAAETADAEKAAPETPAGQAPGQKAGEDKAGAHDKKAKTDAVHAELEAAKSEAAKTKDLFLRTAAEYDNYRKRTTKEKDAAFSNGVSHAAEKVLPLVDTLEIAAAAETADENYKKGVLMTLDKAHAILKDLGLEEIPALDQPFDPALHAAVMQQPTEGKKPGIVVQVYQKGYTLNGRVVRHAMVVVSA